MPSSPTAGEPAEGGVDLKTYAHADHLLGGPLPAGLRAAASPSANTSGKCRPCSRSCTTSRRTSCRTAVRPPVPRWRDFRIGALRCRRCWCPAIRPPTWPIGSGDAVFVGDTLFMPDLGSARADFPGGDARVLYRSMRRLLDLPPETRMFMCHDYPPAGRERDVGDDGGGAARAQHPYARRHRRRRVRGWAPCATRRWRCRR